MTIEQYITDRILELRRKQGNERGLEEQLVYGACIEELGYILEELDRMNTPTAFNCTITINVREPREEDGFITTVNRKYTMRQKGELWWLTDEDGFSPVRGPITPMQALKFLAPSHDLNGRPDFEWPKSCSPMEE